MRARHSANCALGPRVGGLCLLVDQSDNHGMDWLKEWTAERLAKEAEAKRQREEFLASLHLKPCGCGRTPKLQSERETYGHGSFGYSYYVACECGLRTKAFNDYADTGEGCEQRAVDLWNRSRL
jgi:hypothetical protein